jgi:hypothetical protein
MSEINDSTAGRYSDPFRDAAARFVSLFEEPWEVGGVAWMSRFTRLTI